MTTFDRVKKLAEEQKISIIELEEKLGLGKNSLYSWKKKIPNGANLEKVADFFNVSVDYILGRTDIKDLPIDNKVQNIAAHHDGDEWTEEELQEIEEFKRFVAMRRKARQQKGE
ncbi:helix-turn-helix transcriptional regulator [Lysinibacillus fusiformis]|uniref:helix-turn-helix domain-containing protein n=1 Tax=Lysinibacillus fusiformis TaxID=28031 RepID=UPI001F4D3C99|nr:helix-turn-helix transcriptional regulator [Lysinibacillus fusiformis]MCK1989435.1 helix-turn-helix transcriptional regulator [Lysinibacillus fusiformis]